MTRSELISRLANHFRQLVREDIGRAVKIILDTLSDRLAAGDRAEIRGFGTFSVHIRPPRLARNPKTGECVPVPAKRMPYFKPGVELRQRANGKKVPAREPKHSTGRPPTHGAKPGWELLRSSIAIEAFTKAREAGEKYEIALEAAVAAVQQFDPAMKASPSVIKKILRELISEDREVFLRVTKTEHLAPDGKRQTQYGIGFAPRPDYPHPSKKISG